MPLGSLYSQGEFASIQIIFNDIPTLFGHYFRNFETASLQVGDMEFNLHGPVPDLVPFFRVTLEERKGWQKQAGYEGPRSGEFDIL